MRRKKSKILAHLQEFYFFWILLAFGRNLSFPPPPGQHLGGLFCSTLRIFFFNGQKLFFEDLTAFFEF
jgi:hypothetical protein